MEIQAKKEIQKLILSGEFLPAEKLPFDRKLQVELGIRQTTRRAGLEELQREGMINCYLGKGRYIAKTILDQQLIWLAGFSQDIQKKGIPPAAKVIFQVVEGAQLNLLINLNG